VVILCRTFIRTYRGLRGYLVFDLKKGVEGYQPLSGKGLVSHLEVRVVMAVSRAFVYIKTWYFIL
jgi:hypothetical protein